MSSRDSRALPAYGAVRISPDGERLAWLRPGFDGDPHPWLVIQEDAVALGVQHDWVDVAEVAGWTPLEDMAVVRADERAATGLGDAELLAATGQLLREADPVPAELADRIRAALDGDRVGEPGQEAQS